MNIDLPKLCENSYIIQEITARMIDIICKYNSAGALAINNKEFEEGYEDNRKILFNLILSIYIESIDESLDFCIMADTVEGVTIQHEDNDRKDFKISLNSILNGSEPVDNTMNQIHGILSAYEIYAAAECINRAASKWLR